MQNLSREELVYMVQIAEQSERYEDMLEYMKRIGAIGQELSVEERNYLGVAHKNIIGPRRSAWRVLQSIKQKEEQKGEQYKILLNDFQIKIENEISKQCNDTLNILEKVLIPSASNADAKVFYMKMKADQWRYIAEYSEGDQLNKAADTALEFYQAATEIANKDLKTVNPIRLGLALNFSVFYYEILNEPNKACHLAKTAFEEALADIESLDDLQYKDTNIILQFLRDSLTLWTTELEGEHPENS